MSQDLAGTLKTIDGLVAAAKSVQRERSSSESVQMAIDMLTVLKGSGESTIDGAISALNALKPLIDRLEK